MKGCWGLLLLAMLPGCVNLAPIADYADSAKSVVGATNVVERWRSSEQVLSSNNMEGDKCRLARPGIDQAKRDAAAKGIMQIHAVLSSYFGAVGKLASGSSPSPTAIETSGIAHIKDAGIPITSAQETAILSVAKVLTRALDAYRQEKLKDLMEQTDADVSTSIDALLALVAVYKSDLNSERRAVVQWIRQCEAPTTDPAVAFLVRREGQRILAPYRQADAAIDQYQNALIQIKQMHGEILKSLKGNKKMLLDTMKTLGNALKELEAARVAVNNI